MLRMEVAQSDFETSECEEAVRVLRNIILQVN
jgi:hypothetical protein